jgi:hypothetical protein
MHQIKASFSRDGGFTWEDTSSYETLGDAHGEAFDRREDAETVADELRESAASVGLSDVRYEVI